MLPSSPLFSSREKSRFRHDGPLARRLRRVSIVRGRACLVRLTQANPIQASPSPERLFRAYLRRSGLCLARFLAFCVVLFSREGQRTRKGSKWLETQGKALSSDSRNRGIFPNSFLGSFTYQHLLLGSFPYVVLRSTLCVPVRGEEACRARAYGEKPS